MFKKKHYIVAIILLLSFKGLAQVYPVQVSPNMVPPYSMKLSDYNTATREKIMVNLLLTDVAELNRQVGIRMYIENGRNIAVQSSPVVSGAMPIYLDGGVPVRLTNLDLQVYFQYENLQGISHQQYNQPLPDGLYQFCFEVYDWGSGLPISAKSCATAYLVLNDPPILNIPARGELVAQKDIQNIIFQWTPRHMNATNVQYEFTLTELWDQHMDPQAAFLASRPLYETTTSANTLLYGPAETSLLPDKTYGWRVRAVVTDGISETSVFKNDGYSEIFHFVYTGDCNEPAFLLAEAESSTIENIYWQDGGHLKYHVQYRKKALNGTEYNEWFEANAYSNNVTLYNLERGTVYEFRVGGQCNPEGGYSYSQIQEFTTPIDVKSSGYNCGITSEIEITNTKPLPELFRNDVFTAGDFPVTVKEISGGDGMFTGWGYIVVPYLQDTRIRVNFKGININDEYQLINGVVETEYDETWSGVEFANETLEAFEGTLDLTPVQVNFDINPNAIEDYISINANGELQIKDPDTEFVKTYPLGDDYIIKDKNEDGTEDIFYVDEEGNVSYGGQVAEGGPIDISEAPGFNNGQIENLTANGIKVIFIDNDDYKYGIDQIINSQKSVLSNHYKTIEDEKGNPYNIIHKAVKNSGNDIIVGEIETDNEELIKQLIFKTAQGGKIEHTINGNKVTLNLNGHFAFEHEDIYATIQEDNNTQTIAGVFTLWHLSQKNVNVAIVPLGNVQIPSNLEAELQAMYGPAAVNLNITQENTLDIDSSVWDIENGNNKLDVGERGWFSNYTTEQKAIIKHYEQQGGKGENKYIIFITNITPSRDIQGFMPLKRQHGFIFNSVTKGSEETKESITQVIAHEIGHGVFGLEHPFSELKTSQSATDWLMDYAGGTTFSHMEWAKMHNPGLQLHLFQNSDEGEYTDTEFADKVFQIIRCAYLNSGENEIISFDTSVLGKTGTFHTEWQGDKIWIKIDNGSFEGMAVYEPVELVENKENKEPWRYSLLYKNVEIYTPRYSTGADPLELQKLRTYLFPEDKSQFKKETEKILTDFLEKNELTDKDFEKLKSVANCGIQYFTPKQRYSIIAKIVNNRNITEYYEDLILDLVETSPLNDEADYYNEFLGYLLEKDSKVLKELFADVDDAGITTLWKGRENNYTRFINALANITAIINSDVKKWQIVNHIINSDYGDIEDVEKRGITTILSSMDENSEIVEKVPAISELFVNLLIDDCEELKDYKIIFDIATLQNSNRELFASFTQSESTVILNNEKVRVTFGKTFFSWVKPVVFTIKELYKDERKIEERELGNYYVWSKFLAEDENKHVANLLDSNPQEYFQILYKQASDYIGEAQTENSDFWASIQTIDCNNKESILNHINANENSNSLKKVNNTIRLDLLVKMFDCNWFRVSDVDAVYDYSEDVLIKLVASFDPTDNSVLQTIENSIGLNKVYDKLYGERLSKFLAWMGSQIISSDYQIELSKEDVFKSEELKDKEELLMLESDLFSFKNFSIDDIGQNSIKIDSQELAYNQMVLVYVSGSFTFLGQKFNKGDVLQMPLVQAFAMSNSNRNIVIEKGAWATVDVVALAVGVGSIKIVFSVGNSVRKAIVISDLLGSSSGLLANALANDAISEETRFQLNMLALVASTPLLATSSKKIDDLITALDDKISSNAKLDKATKDVLDEHLEKIAEKIGTDDLKLDVIKLSEAETKLVEDLVNSVDDVYKEALKLDLETSTGLIKFFTDNPDMMNTWKKLSDYSELRRDITVLESYANIKRIGNYTAEVKPIRVSELTKTHPTPKLGQESNFSSLKESLKTEGYDLSEPIKVVELPDGTKLLMDGNHRLKAMEDLGQIVVPAHVMSLEEARQGYIIVESIASNIEIAKLSGNYKGTYQVDGLSAKVLEETKLEAIEFMDKFFPGWNKSTSVQILNSDFKEIPVSDLKMMIQTDGTNGRGLTKEYADKISKTGYDVESIEPVKIIELPDGAKVIADVESHYRAAAMVQARGTDVPVQYMTYDELLQVRPSSKRQRELTELYFMLKVGQQTDSYKSSWLPDMSWEGEKELFYDIPERIDNFLKAEFPNLLRTIPLRSVDELLNHVDFPQAKKSAFKDELSISPEKAKAFGNNPDLVDAWGVLYDVEVSEEFRKQLNNVYAMEAYIKKLSSNHNNVEAVSFNKFVKHQIDKDAYMKSILSTELYGGIDVSHVSLSHVEPISVKLKTPQYSGAGKFGAYEARIKNGIIERYLVGDNGVGEWHPLNGNTVDDVNFVITTDGKLRIGHGHYNISAEAQSVYSAGKLQIVNGKVTEVSNYSGHYLPPNDNLYQVEKVFKELGITSDDFKIFENPNAVKSASPPINNTTGFKYRFEEEGYVYSSIPDMQTDGTLRIIHTFKKDDGGLITSGVSTITLDGVLENSFDISKTLKGKEVEVAMYNNALRDHVKSIISNYGRFGVNTDSYKAFIENYNKSNDPVQAALATPEGMVLGKDWEPINIQVKDDDVSMQWVKKGTGIKTTDKSEEIIQILKKYNPDCN